MTRAEKLFVVIWIINLIEGFYWNGTDKVCAYHG